jgi:serine/threonine protein kinase
MNDRFQVIKEIGRGGVAMVHKAWDTRLSRHVAIKTVLSDTVISSDLVKESTLTAGLDHPHIVSVYDVGLGAQGGLWIVMEFLNGETIDKILEKGQMGVGEFLQITEQALDGLAAAHRKSILHGDIKPSNIMTHFLTDGTLQTKVLDFGLARIAHQPVLSDVGEDGAVCGSVHFMAPEQLLGSVLDVRSDLYSLGCVCYAMLGGEVPYDGHTMKVIIDKHLKSEPKPLQEIRPDVPPPICEWVHWLMKRDADQRPPDSASALTALKNIIHGDVTNIQEVLKKNATNRATSIVKPTTQIIYDPATRAAILAQVQSTEKAGRWYRSAIAIGFASLGLGVLGIGLGYFLNQRQKVLNLDEDKTHQPVKIVELHPEHKNNAKGHSVISFKRLPDFIYGDWKSESLTQTQEGLNIQSPSAMGGFGYLVTENLSEYQNLRPSIRLRVGANNTLKNLKILMRKDDTLTAVWYFNLESSPREKDLLISVSRQFPIHLPQEIVDRENQSVVTSDHPIMDFSDIKQIHLSGDYLPTDKVDITLQELLLTP